MEEPHILKPVTSRWELRRSRNNSASEDPETGKTAYFVSNTMILGERGAVDGFTEIFKPVVKHAGLLGWRGITYVDDFGHVGETEDKCKTNREILQDVAKQVGWIIS